MSTLNTSDHVLQIKIDDILPNRYQPRKKFKEESIKELAMSIKEYGILNPLLVRQIADKYELIAGERRWRAAKSIGMTTVPAIVKNISDSKMAEMALIENLQRENLTSIEEAKSFNQILKLTNITQTELAQKLGKSQSSIANKLRLLSLPIEIQNAVEQKQISERHARSLLRIKNPEQQKQLLQEIINKKLTIKDLEKLIDEKEIKENNELEISNISDSIKEEKNNKKESDNMNNNMNFFPNNQNLQPNLQPNLNYQPNNNLNSTQTPNENNINPIPDFMPNNNITPNNNVNSSSQTNVMSSSDNILSGVPPMNSPIEAPQPESTTQPSTSENPPLSESPENKFIQDVPLFSANETVPIQQPTEQPNLNVEQQPELTPSAPDNFEIPVEPQPEMPTLDNYNKTIEFLNKENISYKTYSNETNKCIIIEF